MQNKHGGFLKKYSILTTNIITFILLCIINLFELITSNRSIILFGLYTIPFIIAIIICTIFRKHYITNAILFAVMSIFALISTKEIGNLTGLVFLFYSLYIFVSLKTNIILLIITALIIASKVFMGATAMQIVATYIGYAYCIRIYYILMHPKTDMIPCEIDAVNRQIIMLMTKGYNNKEIGDKISLSSDAVRKRINRVCYSFKCKNGRQLIYRLSELGYFKK